MTETAARGPKATTESAAPPEAIVAILSAGALAAAWAVVADTDTPAAPAQVMVSVARPAPPAPGLVPASAPRRVIVVRRRSRAS